ncbi:MAG: hypothetical protein CFH19_00432 [Alphaproteobacteria bacterium MarineAlpha5_Bin9]|nr:MAG: hypothetical protein CFH19_00432 [Alphaproteobacteria bacterium MarineAlpha5_Bin9]|tara:strand:- start:2291 stop:3322 length:1032 start_codon:yes stop_codon:yes gene_type:complete
MNKIKKICFSRIDKMGDMILTIPILKGIKKLNPDIKIDVLASSENAKILKKVNYVNQVIIIENRKNFILQNGKLRIVRNNKYDFFVNLSPSILSFFYCFFSGAKIKSTMIYLSRYSNNRFSKILIKFISKIFCKHIHIVNRKKKLDIGEDIHQTKMMFKLISKLNIDYDQNTNLEINLPKNKLNIINNKKLITIHVSDRWIKNKYNENDFINLINLLPKEKYIYALTTDKTSRKKFRKIYNLYKIISNNNFKNLNILKDSITIFDELEFENWKKIIYSSYYIISPEGGCVHLAAACMTPVIILYDSNNLPEAIHNEYHPWKNKYKKIVSNDLNINLKIVNSLD